MKIEMKKGELSCVLTGTKEEMEVMLETAENIMADLREDQPVEEPEQEDPEKIIPVRVYESVCHENKLKRAIDWLEENNIPYIVDNDGVSRKVETRLTPSNIVELRSYIYEDGCDRCVII